MRSVNGTVQFSQLAGSMEVPESQKCYLLQVLLDLTNRTWITAEQDSYHWISEQSCALATDAYLLHLDVQQFAGFRIILHMHLQCGRILYCLQGYTFIMNSFISAGNTILQHQNHSPLLLTLTLRISTPFWAGLVSLIEKCDFGKKVLSRTGSLISSRWSKS